MTDPTPSPEFEAEVRTAEAVPGPSAEFTAGLRQRLAARAASLPAARRPARPALAWAVPAAVLLILAAAVLAIGPQKVLAAMQGLLGYVPGIGQVQLDGGLRLVAPGAAVERDGIRLSVERGAADALHTVLVYRAEGLSIAAANSAGESAATGGLAALLLPDGSLLSFTGQAGRGWGTGYENRLTFPALPGGVLQAELLISRLDGMPAGAAPEDWRIPLQFQPAPADLKVMPVYEIATAQPAAAAQATLTLPASAARPAAAPGPRFTLERVLELEDGFQLQGSLAWDGAEFPGSLGLGAAALLKDGAGQVIPSEETSAEGSTAAQPWALRTNSKARPGPWQVIFPAVQVYHPAEAAFQLDLGRDPGPGQAWDLNLDLDAAGHPVRILRASLSQDSRSGIYWLEFVYAGGPEQVELGLVDLDNLSPRIGGKGGPAGEGQTSLAFSYDQKPSGVHHLRVTNISYTLAGPWSLSWNPPASAAQAAATPAPQAACLNDASWAGLQNQPAAALPAGRLLLETSSSQLMPQMSLAALDGSQPVTLGIGGWSSLSPDGSTAAYITSSGPNIFLLDLASGKSRPLPGSGPDDYSPLFSPDGQSIAYVRGTQGIFIQRLDGSGQKQVTTPRTLSFLAGWLPDGKSLVVTTLSAGGSLVQVVDLASGQRSDRFTINNAKGGFARLSPDGKRLVYSEMMFGKGQYALWLANLDGSGKRLLADLETNGVSAGAWSPDSAWLALAVVDFNQPDPPEQLYLLQPETCQVRAVKNLSGRVNSWAAPRR